MSFYDLICQLAELVHIIQLNASEIEALLYGFLEYIHTRL